MTVESSNSDMCQDDSVLEYRQETMVRYAGKNANKSADLTLLRTPKRTASRMQLLLKLYLAGHDNCKEQSIKYKDVEFTDRQRQSCGYK